LHRYYTVRLHRMHRVQAIKMPFGLWTQVGPMNHTLDGGPVPPQQLQQRNTTWRMYRQCFRMTFSNASDVTRLLACSAGMYFTRALTQHYLQHFVKFCSLEAVFSGTEWCTKIGFGRGSLPRTPLWELWHCLDCDASSGILVDWGGNAPFLFTPQHISYLNVWSSFKIWSPGNRAWYGALTTAVLLLCGCCDVWQAPAFCAIAEYSVVCCHLWSVISIQLYCDYSF